MRLKLSAVLTTGIITAGSFLAVTLSGTGTAAATTITNGDLGFDSATQDSPTQLQCLRSKGYSFDLVYLNRAGAKTEIADAQAAGMSYVLQQGYGTGSQWTNAANGTSIGQTDVSFAQSVNYPQGSQIFLDVESNTNASASTAVSWIENWAKVVKAAGYVAGAYIGVPQSLSAGNLGPGTLPDISVYWQSESSSAPDPAQGYAVVQSLSTSVCSDSIDPDHATIDQNGNGLVGSGGPSNHLAVAFEADNTNLWTWGGAPATVGYGASTYPLGMAAGTSPAIAKLANGNYAVAFQSNGHQLWTWTGQLGQPGSAVNTGLGMAKNASPSIAAIGSNAVVAFQANTGTLWTWGGTPATTGFGTETGLGMAPNTNPAVAAGGQGAVVAFQANNNNLWTWSGAPGTKGAGRRTYPLGMQAATSPSIAAASNGNFVVAFQANTSYLWTWTGAALTDGTAASSGQGMNTKSSPSIVYLGGQSAAAFEANTNQLWTWSGTAGTLGVGATTGLGMSDASSPALAASGSSIAAAFTSNGTQLWTWGGLPASTGVGTNTGLGMAAGTGPAAAA